MSNTAKIVIGVVIVLVLLVLAFGMRSTNGTLPSGTDTSDQSLKNDTAAIDQDLNGLDQDRATIDQGLAEPSVE